MEHCVDILLEEFLPDADFASPKPISTAWGDAWDDDPEKLIWQEGLFVKLLPPELHLLTVLPHKLQGAKWIRLAIYGEGLKRFEAAVSRSAMPSDDCEETQEPLEHQLLLRLINRLLREQKRWAAFFARDCDDIKHVYRQDLAALMDTILKAYQYETEASEGFCSYFMLGDADDSR